jgi:hypothetical protein
VSDLRPTSKPRVGHQKPLRHRHKPYLSYLSDLSDLFRKFAPARLPTTTSP